MNKVNLVGRLTADPHIEEINGSNCVRFTVSLLRGTNPANGIDYVSCAAYDENAQFIEKNFQCGDNISIVGTIRTEKNKINNRTIYSTRILVEEVHYIRDPRATENIEFYR